MIPEKISGLLGMARRAGKLVAGEANCEAVLKKGQASMLIVAEDVSSKNIEKYRLWCQDIGIPCYVAGTKVELGIFLGQSPRGVLAFIDEGFAKAVEKALIKM